MKKEKPSIVIGTKTEALWTKVKEAREKQIDLTEENLIIEKALLELAEQKIQEEKLK